MALVPFSFSLWQLSLFRYLSYDALKKTARRQDSHSAKPVEQLSTLYCNGKKANKEQTSIKMIWADPNSMPSTSCRCQLVLYERTNERLSVCAFLPKNA